MPDPASPSPASAWLQTRLLRVHRPHHDAVCRRTRPVAGITPDQSTPGPVTWTTPEKRRPGSSRFVRPCRCTAVARRRTFSPSSEITSHQRSVLPDQLIRHQMRRRVTHQFIPHLLGVPTGSAQAAVECRRAFLVPDAQPIANCSSAPLLRAILGRIPPPADAGHAWRNNRQTDPSIA